MRAFCTVLVVVASLFTAVAASAQVPLDIGIAIKGGAAIQGVDKPDTREYKGEAYDITYPGFFGVAGGVGFFVEPRLLDLVGIELGLIWEQSQGEGDISDRPLTIKSSDLVIPIHARIATPGFVKFVASLGVDFIIPLSTSYEADEALSGIDFKVLERDATTYLGFGLGVEIDAIVVKIPVELRGRWAAGLGDSFDDRLGEIESTNHMVTRYEVKPNWEFQGEIMVGVKYEIDIL